MKLPSAPLLILLPSAIAIGLSGGKFFPDVAASTGQAIDPLVLVLLVLLLFDIPLKTLPELNKNLRFISISWVVNFLLIPVIGWGIASILFSLQQPILIGIFLYFLFPCTDWFLAFTRISKGDTILGSALIPINLTSQLLLFPIYLLLFTGSDTSLDLRGVFEIIIHWFVLPFALALILKIFLAKFLSKGTLKLISTFTESSIPWILFLLVCSIFASSTNALSTNLSVFPKILLAILLFFVLTTMLGEILAKWFGLPKDQHILLAMTTTARNTPIVLGLASIALPDQPLIYATLVTGMLIEFPLLTLLSRFLLWRLKRGFFPTQIQPIQN